MANGTTRNALAALQIKKLGGKDEMNQQMAILKQGHGDKIPLKAGKSEHNKSSNTLRSKKGGL